jgi:hypothetical protein
MSNPFRYFNSSPEIIRLAVMMYVKYPLSLHVEDLLSERGIDISHGASHGRLHRPIAGGRSFRARATIQPRRVPCVKALAFSSSRLSAKPIAG